jgi:hypothetical protein
LEGHTEEFCRRKNPEKRPESLAQMFVANTSSKIVKKIRGILYGNEKRLLSLVKSILKVVVKKKKKKKESYINMMSYPHAQDSPISKMKS